MTENPDQPAGAEARASGASDRLSGYIIDNIEKIASFQANEQQKLGDSRRRLGWVGDIVAHPGYLLSLLSVVAVWIALNALGPRIGWMSPLDPPPFAWLQGCLTLVGVVTATVVVIAQNRFASLDSQRSHLDLQVNLLTEQKVTKVIHLLEELRRDLPMVEDRHDSDAVALQQHTNTEQVLSAIRSAASGTERTAPPAPIL